LTFGRALPVTISPSPASESAGTDTPMANSRTKQAGRQRAQDDHAPFDHQPRR
jgi:hypothetical protein